MDWLSRIGTWLSDNEAMISAIVGIAVLAGIVLAGLRSLVRRRGETAQATAPSATATEPAPAEAPAADLDPLTVPGFEGRPAIAVLPFDNLSGDPEQEYFADGIAEDLIARLSAWRDFPVIARNSSFVYKGKPVDVKQVSRELGVRYVVEGSVRKTSDRVRIAAQLIDASTGGHVWAKRYDRKLEDIFAIQDEISLAIVEKLKVRLLGGEKEKLVKRYTHDQAAYNLYLKGRYFWNRRYEVGMKKSLEYFSREFSPYQHRQVRILEFPRYATFAQSFPNTIPYSESIGFIARIKEDDIDYPFYVTAHEVAHQWWAHQVIGGNVEGATVAAEVLRHGRSRKVVVFKKKRRKNYRRKKGHRQAFTEVNIKGIDA